jgi:hypothetical protein
MVYSFILIQEETSSENNGIYDVQFASVLQFTQLAKMCWLDDLPN